MDLNLAIDDVIKLNIGKNLILITATADKIVNTSGVL